jgi:hypothetical protein
MSLLLELLLFVGRRIQHLPHFGSQISTEDPHYQLTKGYWRYRMMIIYGCCRYIIMMGVTMQLNTSTPLHITPLKLHVTLDVFFHILQSVPCTKLVEAVPCFPEGW